MLYFREKESQKLQRFIDNPEARAMAVYGRRRTGKTSLLLDYIGQHPEAGCIYFQCTSTEYNTCLKDFIALLSISLPESASILAALTSFRDVFLFLSQSPGDRRIFIVDEFPFLAKKKEDAATEFQWIIDHGLGKHKLVLLGSSLSFMRHQIQDREAPLYGRFHDVLELLPFKFSEVQQLFPVFEDAVEVYAQTGGVAQYVMWFLEYPSVQAATDALFLDRNGLMYQEAGNLLMQELKDPASYIAILRGMAGGEKTSNQISKASGIEQRALYSYLNRLQELEIVEVSKNPLSEAKRDTRYRIKDLFFQFHSIFVDPHASLISALEARAREYILQNKYSEYLGLVYEAIIRENIFQYALNGQLEFMPLAVGKWWGPVCEQGIWKESEVDLIAFDDHHIVIGECKYRNKQVGLKEYNVLREKAQFIPMKGRTPTYLLASRSGFTAELLQQSLSDLILIDKI